MLVVRHGKDRDMEMAYQVDPCYGGPMPQSLEGKRETSRKKREERRAVAYAYLGNRCSRCNVTINLDMDHIDPATKIIKVSMLWTATEEKFWTEVKKCQLLCKDHHLEKTLAERFPPRQHGTIAMYGRGNCRCNLCTAAKHEQYIKRRNSLGA